MTTLELKENLAKVDWTNHWQVMEALAASLAILSEQDGVDAFELKNEDWTLRFRRKKRKIRVHPCPSMVKES